jgi:hypothetical protein
MSCQNAGQKANRRAGIACVQYLLGRFQSPQAAPPDSYGLAAFLHFHSEGLEACKSAVTIAAGREIFDYRSLFRNGSQHGIAMRNRFVSGQQYCPGK